MLSDYDRDNIGQIVGGHGDWFTAHLIRLIAKADLSNRALIAKGFPEVVDAFNDWELHPPTPDPQIWGGILRQSDPED